MKFSTRKEAELPATELFDAISDADRIAAVMRRRGAKVTRSDKAEAPAWDIRFQWRGRQRNLNLAVTETNRPERMVMQGVSDAFDLTITMTVVALGHIRSRLIFEAELRPRNMRARLLLQTAKLGKAQLDPKFDRGVEKLMAEMIAKRA